jgi:hypothetical protein
MLTILSTALLFTATGYAQCSLKSAGIRFWLERADLIRGPEHYGEDNYYNSYLLAPGSLRGFTANACWNLAGNCTQAIDGTTAWDAMATSASTSYHKDVIGPAGQTMPGWARCGQWLNSTISYRGTLYGFVHGENPAEGDTTCENYATHHKTMTQWSTEIGVNAGLSWSNPVEVIDSTFGSPSTESGEGDCTAIADAVYAYLFCRRPTDLDSTVARKSLSSLGKPKVGFVKYDSGWGSKPGLNGTDSPLTGLLSGTSTNTNKLGSSVSYWKDQNWIMLLNVEDITFGGLKASLTTLPNLQSNAIAFTTLPEPLFIQEPDPRTGHYPYETHPPRNLYIYPSAISLIDGSRAWDLTQKNQFLLVYTVVPNYNDLDTQRILAMRSVTVTKSSTSQDPLVALTTRYDSNHNQRYTSTQPLAVGDPSTVPQTYAAGSFARIVADPVAYLAQKPSSQQQMLIKLVECRSSLNPPWPGSGHPDRLITDNTCDANYAEDTVAGYSFPRKPATGRSVEIFRCQSNANGTHWVSSSNNCEGIGTNEKSLGWGLMKLKSGELWKTS